MSPTTIPGNLILKSRATGWNPSFISTALWLDAADASTITESGGAVSQWDDKSGGGINFTQATSTARPSVGVDTLNGKNVVTFDGTSDWMGAGDALDTVWTGNGFNVFFVAKNNAVTSSNGLILGKLSGSPLNLRQFVSYVRSGVSQFAAYYNLGLTAYTSVNSSTSIGSSQWVMCSQAYDNTLNTGASANTTVRVQMTVDGAEQTETVGLSAGNLGSIQDGAGLLSIGALVGDGTQFAVPLDGAIGELIVTPSVASVSDRQKIEGYLAHKWGLTANLPADHPYKTVEPTP